MARHENSQSDHAVSHSNENTTLVEKWSVTRRGAIGAAATVVGGGTAIALVASQEGRAAVSVESLTVDDATFESASVDPVIDATVGWAFAYDAPHHVRVGLLVDGEVIAYEQLRTSSTELENETELTGRVVDTASFALSDFEVARGESTTIEVPVSVRFAVLVDGEAVAEDTANQTADVVVAHPQGDEYASVGGVASIRDSE